MISLASARISRVTIDATMGHSKQLLCNIIGASLSEPHSWTVGHSTVKKTWRVYSHVHKLIRARAALCNVWQCTRNWQSKAKKQDRLRRERETPEKRDARFVNVSPTCLPHIPTITVGWWGVEKITELDVMQWVQKNDRLHFSNKESVSSLSPAHLEKQGLCEAFRKAHFHYNYCSLERCRENYRIRHDAIEYRSMTGCTSAMKRASAVSHQRI